MVLLLQDDDRHVEMMILHGGGGVDGGQRRPDVDHELVIEASVVQIMTEGSDEHSQGLHQTEVSWRVLHHGVDTVGNIEPVGPVMVGHGAVVLLHRNEESNLKGGVNLRR